jgi:hypothetical protein
VGIRPDERNDEMRATTIYRALAASAATCMFAGLYASAASAAEPAQQGCVGETYSTVTQLLPPSVFGQLVATSARFGGPLSTQPGVGDSVQIVQAGDAPDTVVPNTCND